MSRRRNDNQGPQALCDAPVVDCAKATTPASPLQWYGSLQSHARKIAAMLPPHDHYIEPFAGTAAVLLAQPKPSGKSKTECISDIDQNIANFWRVVQRPASRRRLVAQVEMTPYSRAVYRDCVASVREGGGDSVHRAWAFLVTCRMSRNGRGTRASYWSNSKRISNQHADSWAALPARLQKTGRRLGGVQIKCLPFEDALIDAPRTVAFLDPPYMPETRVELGVYPHEFSHKQHQHMLQIVCKLTKTKVIICGYKNALYSEWLEGWRRTDFQTKSYAGPTIKGRKLPSRVLSIWANFASRE